MTIEISEAMVEAASRAYDPPAWFGIDQASGVHELMEPKRIVLLASMRTALTAVLNAAPCKSEPDLIGMAHEIWATAQLSPGEGVADAVCRISAVLRDAACKSEQKTTVTDEMVLRAFDAATEHVQRGDSGILTTEGMRAALEAALDRKETSR